jgi:Tfp pilus assembly protein PilZ
MEKRKVTRVAFRNAVHVDPNKSPENILFTTSFTTDISERGTHVKTNRIYRPGTKLYLIIETSNKSYEAEGIVVWAKKVPPRLVRVVKNGMGIRFTNVCQELVDLYIEKLTLVA